MKKLFLFTLLCIFTISSAQQTSTSRVPITRMVTGPNGTLASSSSINSNTASISCIVSGVLISTSGSINYNYNSNNPLTCAPSAPFSGLGNWTVQTVWAL